jgi:hypothetical protein
MRQMQTRDEQYYTVVCVPEALVQPLWSLVIDLY